MFFINLEVKHGMNGQPLACLIRDEIAVSQTKLKSDTVRFQRHHESKSFQHLPVSFQNPSHVGLSQDKVLQNPRASSEVQNLIFSSLDLPKKMSHTVLYIHVYSILGQSGTNRKKNAFNQATAPAPRVHDAAPLAPRLDGCRPGPAASRSDAGRGPG